jgi:hypothetical protein
MFGESKDIEGGHQHEDGIYGRSLKVELERMVAMITVKINGSLLSPNVEIIPISVQLHNVPSWCTFGVNNVITRDGLDDVTPAANDRIIPQDGAITATSGTGIDVSGWSTLSGGNSIGGHYTDLPGDIDWDNEKIQPLFMYENYHGNDFGESGVEQKYKRPAASIAGEDAYSATPTRAEIAAVTGACSYLEVRARYHNTATNEYGTVTYRMFLGSNATDDFNVMRNTYYRITLSLNGTAIEEGNITWRVDSNLGKLDVIGDSDIILNGGGETAFIEIPMPDAKNPNAKFSVEIEGEDPEFVWINTGTGGNIWTALDDVDRANFPSGLVNGVHQYQFRFFIQPMIPGVTWNGPGNVRSVKFRFSGDTNSSDITEWITITQYEPLVVTIDDNSPENIRTYAEDVLGWTLPRTFYLDRMDRADSWGFENQPITNSGSGFANVDYLLRNHAMADDYLPDGVGSVMMRAAYMPYYQRAAPAGIPMAPTIANIRGGFASPAGYPTQFFMPSVNEWRLLDMLFEADVQVEDPTVSPIIWNNYWTSDAAPNNESYVYRMGHPEEEIEDKDTAPRTESVSYRMMYW